MIATDWPIALSTGCCRRAPLAGVLRAFESAGVRRIEVGTPPEHFDCADDVLPGRIAVELRRWPFAPVSVHAPFGPSLDLSSPNAAERRAGIAAAIASAGILAGHPGAILVAHPSDIAREGSHARELLRRSLESLLAIDVFCRDAGLRLAIETPLPHLVGGHPDEMAWLLDRLPPSVGVCLDTGHAHLGRYTSAFIELAGPRLAHVHVHDNHGTYDDHLIPGRGAIDWCGVFDALRAVRYAGALVLELACAEPSVPYFSEALEAARAICLAHAPARLPAHSTGAQS
jgi:sugar phosphate isomerase/epimerase